MLVEDIYELKRFVMDYIGVLWGRCLLLERRDGEDWTYGL